MRPTQFRGARTIGMVALALLLVATLAPVVSAQGAPDGYAGVVGKWSGYVTGPSGSSTQAVWTINPDGTFSIQTDAYTAVGTLQGSGANYAFSYERNGATVTGALVAQQSNGRSRLVGRGEAPDGPINVTLTR